MSGKIIDFKNLLKYITPRIRKTEHARIAPHNLLHYEYITPQKIQKRIGSHKYQGYTKQKWHKWKRSEEGWQEAVAVPASINLR
jgi:hypothetical protein